MKKKVIAFVFLSILLFSSISLIKSQEVSTLATVEVKPAYDLDINISILNNKLSSGENLSVSINLKKTDLTNTAGEISVDLNYEITGKGKKAKTIESGFLKTVNITNESVEIVEIPVSPDLKGRHILKIIASNPQSNSDEDIETFAVRKRNKFSFSRTFLSLFKR